MAKNALMKLILIIMTMSTMGASIGYEVGEDCVCVCKRFFARISRVYAVSAPRGVDGARGTAEGGCLKLQTVFEKQFCAAPAWPDRGH